MLKKVTMTAVVALGLVSVASGDAFAFGRGFGGGDIHAGAFHAGGFGGFHGGGFRGFGGYHGGLAGYRGFRGGYAGYGRWGHRYGYYGSYGYADDGAVAGAVLGGLALGAIAAAAGGY